MGAWHPSGRARVNARHPSAFAVCGRCNFTYNLVDLQWQFQWSGLQLQNLQILVCDTCLDSPQPQLKTIILPPDPLPVLNSRPDRFDLEVPSFLMTEERQAITTETGQAIIWQIGETPSPDPDNPVIND